MFVFVVNSVFVYFICVHVYNDTFVFELKYVCVSANECMCVCVCVCVCVCLGVCICVKV